VSRQSHRTSLRNQQCENVPGMPVRGSVLQLADWSRPAVLPSLSPNRTVGVVIACFDVARMSLLLRAVQSVCNQDYPNELTVVVDHNEDLYLRMLRTLPTDVSVTRNTRTRGAAGARNTAALRSNCSLVAFLDDDAYARPGWLRSLVYAIDRPDVVGVGGRILPRWEGQCPRWFPPEFGWVVGASIAGAGSKDFPVRNVWSGSMMVDREAFQAVDGFREDLSKVGSSPQPEDTELCLRLSHAYGAEGKWLMVPSALVEHYVPVHRATLRYVVVRCWLEGRSKVRLRAIAADRSRALADEKIYLSRMIPRAVGAGVVQSLRLRSLDGLMRSGAILLGVGAAMLGAVTAALGRAFNLHKPGRPA
jgi:glucosyl-dolichyl phosphate glucuronosyltransferase